jgi:dienelactone hydrolase
MKPRECASLTGVFFFVLLATGISGCAGGSDITVSLTPNSTKVQTAGTQAFTATVSNDSDNKGVTWTISPASGAGTLTDVTGTSATYNAPASTPASNLTVTITASSLANPSKSASATVTVQAVTVSVSPNSTTVQAAGTQGFTATIGNDGSNKGVSWSLSPASGAGTLSNLTSTSATYNAPAKPPASDMNVMITATSVVDTSKSGSAAVTVPAVAVSVSPNSATVQPSKTTNFTATVTNDPANAGVNWTVSCSVAPCGIVSPTTTASGVATTYTAPSTAPLSGLTVTVTAASVTDPSKSASATVSVSGVTVSVSPSSAKLQAGATQQFTATVSNDPTNGGVKWTLTESGALCSPSCGTISASATASGTPTTYTAPATPPSSDLTVTITATSVVLNSASASATVTVLAITISVTPISALLPGGTTQQVTAMVNNDPAKGGVIWGLTQNGTSCTATACGAISSSSANPITYTAPTTVSANSTVMLVATSVTDATKLASATLMLTIGFVKIVPASLAFGQVVKFQTSSPQTTTLTNTANTTLSIASATLTGSTPQDFSLRSNNCGTSVAAGNSCAITVVFTPKALAALTDNLTISDNSPDSPQQVGLSGIGVRHVALQSALRSTLGSSSSAVVPRPAGPSSVGTRVMHLLDSSRDDPYLGSGAKRELLVKFWYPAINQNCNLAPYTSPAVWNYFSSLLGLPLPEVQTNSCQDAAIEDGLHPVVIFTPGYTGTFTDYTFIFEDLASRGYVVASVDHPYEATAVEFPDGRFVKSVFGSHLSNTLRGDRQDLTFAVSVRLEDLRFVTNDLERLNAEAGSPFGGKLDISRIALAGHSLGGLTTMLGVEQEPRLKAGIIIDGGVPSDLVTATHTAVLILAAGREQWSENDRYLWGQLLGPRVAVNLKGSEHETPSDALWLARGAIKTGAMGEEKTVAAVRDYIAAFLDANLLGKAIDPLLGGPSSEYPDAEVTTRNESLPAKP